MHLHPVGTRAGPPSSLADTRFSELGLHKHCGNFLAVPVVTPRSLCHVDSDTLSEPGLRAVRGSIPTTQSEEDGVRSAPLASTSAGLGCWAGGVTETFLQVLGDFPCLLCVIHTLRAHGSTGAHGLVIPVSAAGRSLSCTSESSQTPSQLPELTGGSQLLRSVWILSRAVLRQFSVRITWRAGRTAGSRTPFPETSVSRTALRRRGSERLTGAPVTPVLLVPGPYSERLCSRASAEHCSLTLLFNQQHQLRTC